MIKQKGVFLLFLALFAFSRAAYADESPEIFPQLGHTGWIN